MEHLTLEQQLDSATASLNQYIKKGYKTGMKAQAFGIDRCQKQIREINKQIEERDQ
jgi:hypothetical protein